MSFDLRQQGSALATESGAEDKTNDKQRDKQRILIVGNGPVGIRSCNLLLGNLPDCHIDIFGDERSTPYNRVRLSNFLSGEIEHSELANPLLDEDDGRVNTHWGSKVVAVNPVQKLVSDNQGGHWHYDCLIIATGARARWPTINLFERPQDKMSDHSKLAGIFVFRTIEDAVNIRHHKENARHFIVVGGGALGIETAHAIKNPGNQVCLITRTQLIGQDFAKTAQLVLREHLQAKGIRLNQNEVTAVCGEGKVQSVQLASGEQLPCDCLIFCIGIKPNIQLAHSAGLAIDKGILVDAFGRTSVPEIYAIGECSQREEKLFGIVTPGYIQAEACILDLSRRYRSSQSKQTATPMNDCINENWHKNDYPLSVKLQDYTAIQLGKRKVNGAIEHKFVDHLRGVYRKIIIFDNAIAGATIVGPCSELTEIKLAIESKKKISRNKARHFDQTGRLFSKESKSQIDELADDYIICLCQGTCKGEIKKAIASGNRSIDGLGKELSVGVNCGSCKPLLAEMLSIPAPNLVNRFQQSIYLMSVVSLLLIALLLVIHPLPVADSISRSWYLEKLWFDNYWKQVSGYTLLGLCVIAAALTLRKRIKKFNLGHLDIWRHAHSIVGLIAVIILLVHTGGRLGVNLNFVLMSVFIAAVTTGSLVGIFMSRNHHWSDLKLRKHRLWWSRLHHTLLWSLPPLLGFHILSVYYF